MDVVEKKELVNEGENSGNEENAALHESVLDKVNLVEEEEPQPDESSISNGRYLDSNFITRVLILGGCGFLDLVLFFCFFTPLHQHFAFGIGFFEMQIPRDSLFIVQSAHKYSLQFTSHLPKCWRFI